MTGALKQALTLAVAIVLPATASSVNAAETAGAPNILFVFADQLRVAGADIVVTYHPHTMSLDGFYEPDILRRSGSQHHQRGQYQRQLR